MLAMRWCFLFQKIPGTSAGNPSMWMAVAVRFRDQLTFNITTTPTNSVYGAMQDGYVERFDQKISPRPSFPKRGIKFSPFGKGGIRGIL
jgi:hypothetical protein